MEYWDELVQELRGLIVEGVVLSIDDSGQAQTITVKTHDNITRTGIEVMQLFGAASRPPAAGAVACLLAIGGDPGHYKALPLMNASFRLGGRVEGDGGAIYAADGSRVEMLAGGIVNVFGFSKIVVQGPQVEIVAPGGVTITGPVTIDGNLVISTGATGTFGTATGETVTVQDGIIVNID